MSRKTKFRKGRPIKTMAALSREIESQRYIYLNHKPLHFGWTSSMQWRSLYLYVKSGRAFYALENR